MLGVRTRPPSARLAAQYGSGAPITPWSVSTTQAPPARWMRSTCPAPGRKSPGRTARSPSGPPMSAVSSRAPRTTYRRSKGRGRSIDPVVSIETFGPNFGGAAGFFSCDEAFGGGGGAVGGCRRGHLLELFDPGGELGGLRAGFVVEALAELVDLCAFVVIQSLDALRELRQGAAELGRGCGAGFDFADRPPQFDQFVMRLGVFDRAQARR